MPRLSQDIADAVRADGLPRQAIDDAGATHVLYLDGTIVRSMLAADWAEGTLPSDPTPAERAAAIAARAQAEVRARQDADALRARVQTVAQSAVGVSLDALTPGQVRALLALLLWKAGGVAPDGTVRALREWLP